LRYDNVVELLGPVRYIVIANHDQLVFVDGAHPFSISLSLSRLLRRAPARPITRDRHMKHKLIGLVSLLHSSKAYTEAWPKWHSPGGEICGGVHPNKTRTNWVKSAQNWTFCLGKVPLLRYNVNNRCRATGRFVEHFFVFCSKAT
jgi:hypothetical protein